MSRRPHMTHFGNPVFSSLVTMYSDTLFKIILFSTEPFLQSISPSCFDFSNINSYKIETSFKLHLQSSQNFSHVIALPQLITCLFQTWLKSICNIFLYTCKFVTAKCF
jgi:hypothetical protein